MCSGLEESISEIEHGGCVLGVNCDAVYKAMLNEDGYAMKLLEAIHEGEDVYKTHFIELFREKCAELIIDSASYY